MVSLAQSYIKIGHYALLSKYNMPLCMYHQTIELFEKAARV
jgi:hypothetical protein